MWANVDEDGNIIKQDDAHGLFTKVKLLWHADSSYKPVSRKYLLLVTQKVSSEGGKTEFTDL